MMGGKTQAHIRKRSKKQKKSIPPRARGTKQERRTGSQDPVQTDPNQDQQGEKKVLCKQIHTNFLMNHHTKIEKKNHQVDSPTSLVAL
jgi:predicted glycosyl hydrolase (DUF1957 family)